MFYPTRTALGLSGMLALFVGAMGLLPISTALAESDQSIASDMMHMTSMSQPSPGWAERLKGQTIVENVMEGRGERAALVERQHNRMMNQMQKEMGDSRNTGGYNTMSEIHQYGGGPGNYLLSSDGDVEPVSNTGRGDVPFHSTGETLRYCRD